MVLVEIHNFAIFRWSSSQHQLRVRGEQAIERAILTLVRRSAVVVIKLDGKKKAFRDSNVEERIDEVAAQTPMAGRIGDTPVCSHEPFVQHLMPVQVSDQWFKGAAQGSLGEGQGEQDEAKKVEERS